MTGAGPVPGVIGPFTVREGDLWSPFWAGLARGELLVQRCAACERWVWGPQWRCGECGAWDPEWVPVAGRGRVFSWIRTWHRVAPEVADAVPYVTVLVELDDAPGVRLLGLWAPEADPRIGDEVDAVVVPTEQWGPLVWSARAGR